MYIDKFLHRNRQKRIVDKCTFSPPTWHTVILTTAILVSRLHQIAILSFCLHPYWNLDYTYMPYCHFAYSHTSISQFGFRHLPSRKLGLCLKPYWLLLGTGFLCKYVKHIFSLILPFFREITYFGFFHIFFYIFGHFGTKMVRKNGYSRRTVEKIWDKVLNKMQIKGEKFLKVFLPEGKNSGKLLVKVCILNCQKMRISQQKFQNFLPMKRLTPLKLDFRPFELTYLAILATYFRITYIFNILL